MHICVSADSSNEPFVLALQVCYVFYMKDPSENEWHIVIENSPLDLYNML